MISGLFYFKHLTQAQAHFEASNLNDFIFKVHKMLAIFKQKYSEFGLIQAESHTLSKLLI